MLRYIRKRSPYIGILFLVVLFGPIGAAAQRTELDPGMNFFSEQDDIAIGRKFIEESEPDLKVIDDEILAEYVNRLGQQLALVAPGYRFPYQFKLINDTVINAFALPGGPIYLNRGIIEEADREAEVAGVLAHEIGHVALRHGTNQASKAQLIQTPLAILGGIFGGGNSVTSILTQVGAGFAANTVFLRYSRDAERQADLMGAQILYDAGYDPTGMPEFFEKLQAGAGDRGTEFFSSHPNPGNRATDVATEIQMLGDRPQTYLDNFSDFRRIKERLSDIPEASDDDSDRDRPQTNRDSDRGSPELPSSRYQRYRNALLEFYHPVNWNVGVADQTITAAPDGGEFNGNLAYGVYVSRTFEPITGRGGRLSIEDATDQLLDYMRATNPSLRVGQGYRRGRIDRSEALSVGLAMNSPAGGLERDWLLTAFGPDGDFYFFIGAAPADEFDQYQEAFQRLFESIRFR